MLFGVYCCAAGFTGESHAGRHNGSTIVGATAQLVPVKRVVCGGSVGDVVFPLHPQPESATGVEGRIAQGGVPATQMVPVPRPDGACASTWEGEAPDVFSASSR